MKMWVIGLVMVGVGLFIEDVLLAAGIPAWLARGSMYALLYGGMALALYKVLRRQADEKEKEREYHARREAILKEVREKLEVDASRRVN